MVLQYIDYRSFLKAVLADRVAENNGYSLRALAKKLGLANSYLSEVLSGKKPLSAEAALKISVKLGLTETESQYFCILAQLESEGDEEYRQALQDRLRAIRADRKVFDLSSEMFRVIADWYHFAILELTYLSGFTLTAKSAAMRLGVSMAEAEAAIDRLLRLELLERSTRGDLRKARDYVSIQSTSPDVAIKRFHSQLLEKAIESIRTQTPQERISCTDLLPIDSRHLNKVRALSEEYAERVIKISKDSRTKDHVYCLLTHFFKISREREQP